MNDGVIVLIAFYIFLGFVCWCAFKSGAAPSERTEVLKELIKSIPKYEEPKPLWSFTTTTTKRPRKVRRNKPKNEQAEDKE